jgi:hypothetical protein
MTLPCGVDDPDQSASNSPQAGARRRDLKAINRLFSVAVPGHPSAYWISALSTTSSRK